MVTMPFELAIHSPVFGSKEVRNTNISKILVFQSLYHLLIWYSIENSKSKNDQMMLFQYLFMNVIQKNPQKALFLGPLIICSDQKQKI